LTNNCVDFTRTYTNDILEFYEIFGIEATRELIFRELSKVFSGKKPNIRHIQMLSDVMTYRGILMQIERHGLNKNPEVGPLSKASFEEVMNIITNAAVFGEKENMKGVSANIFAGQFCKNGTNSFEIIVDEEKLMQNMDNGEYLLENVNVKPENIDNMMNELYNNK
jgi:DNA-directed RNA polymerase II subunit RPB1